MSVQDQILNKIIEIQEDLSNVRLEMKNFVTKNDFYTVTDQILNIVNRLDQNRVVTDHRITRIEKKLGIHT